MPVSRRKSLAVAIGRQSVEEMLEILVKKCFVIVVSCVREM
jgi:hypothetical protein